MRKTWTHCLYCGCSYPPGELSREHVFPDAFGARLRLPEGAVCRQCNNILNREIDQKLNAMFDPVLAYFGIESEKRPGDSAGRVIVETTEEQYRARIRKGGGVRRPSLQRLRRFETEVPEGTRVREVWQGSVDEMERIVDLRRSQWEEFRMEVGPTAPIQRIGAPLTGSWDTLIRTAARAAINYLGYRRPADAVRCTLSDAKAYVVKGPSEDGRHLTALGPKELAVKPGAVLSVAEMMKPIHRIAVGSHGQGILQCGVVLFDLIWTRVVLTRSWDGDVFYAEEEFNAEAGESRHIDRGFIHPNAFKIVTP